MKLIRRLDIIVAATALVMATAASPAAATAPAAAASPPAATGRLVPLTSLGGGESSAEKMNERGDLVGGSRDAAGNWRPAVWWHGRRSPTALGVDRATPTAISANGHIAGRLWDDSGLFLWRHGTITRVRPPAGISLEAAAVNDRDQVTGTAYDQNGGSRAFLWQRGHLTMLPVPRNATSSAVGINNSGQVIGSLTRRGATAGQAVLWQRGRMIKLGTLGGDGSTAVAINDRGQVIGNSAVAGPAGEHPFRWQHGRMTDLLAHTGATSGRVSALSRNGMMAGSAIWGTGDSRPVLWRNGRMIDVGLPGEIGLGTAVNDRGDVAGPSWAQPTGVGAVPFRWRHGHITVFPEPVGDIAVRVVGIDRHGTVAVAEETTRYGLRLLRSA